MVTLTNEQKSKISNLHAGDYLPSDVSKVTGINIDTVCKIRGRYSFELDEMIIEVSEIEYNALIWFMDNVGSMRQWYAMGKPNPIEKSQEKFSITEHNKTTDNPYVRQNNNAAKKDAKFQSSRKPSGKVFSPTSNFRKEHFSAQVLVETVKPNVDSWRYVHTMVSELGISRFTAELLYKRLYEVQTK